MPDHHGPFAYILRLSLCLIIAGSSAAMPASESVERRLVSMGTRLDLNVEDRDRAAALAASEAAVREIARVEGMLSTWKRGGPLDRLNRARSGKPVVVGTEAAGLLENVNAWSARTRRAFDPTVGPLVRAWDLRGAGRVPAASEIARALAAMGPGVIAIDREKGEAMRRSSRTVIDEGAWGKGYALDCAAAALKEAGVRAGTIDLGGQILALGRAQVSIADPRSRQRVAASLTIDGASVSTSGNSERFVTVAGRRIGHLLDPRTGSPASDFGSATVVAPSGLVADVLSTALFVLGPEKGLALSEQLRREGFAHEALFLIVDGSRLRAAASPGLVFRLEETQP